MSKERPILFSGESMRSILAGTKTQTRRVIKPQPQGAAYWTAHEGAFYPNSVDATPAILRCPYGQPGDRLWIREAFTGDWRGNGIPSPTYINYRADGEMPEQHREDNYWRSPMFMPRWASRITLEITGIRVERLQAISEEDAQAEGVWRPGDVVHADMKGYYGTTDYTARNQFMHTWEAINFDRGFGWESNPWVWVVAFTRKDTTP